MRSLFYTIARQGNNGYNVTLASKLLALSIQKTNPGSDLILIADQYEPLFEFPRNDVKQLGVPFPPFSEAHRRDLDWHVHLATNLELSVYSSITYVSLGTVFLDKVNRLLHLNSNEDCSYFAPHHDAACSLINFRPASLHGMINRIDRAANPATVLRADDLALAGGARRLCTESIAVIDGDKAKLDLMDSALIQTAPSSPLTTLETQYLAGVYLTWLRLGNLMQALTFLDR
jgi:hypothetical protein